MIASMAVALFFSCDMHHEHADAHVHGTARLDLIQEEPRKLVVQFEAPGATLYGFEYKPQKKIDIANQEAALHKLEEKIESMLGFSQESGCKLSDSDVQVDYSHGTAHSEVRASFEFLCAVDLNGQTLSLNFGKHYPLLETLHAQILSDNKQSKMQFKHGQGSLEL